MPDTALLNQWLALPPGPWPPPPRALLGLGDGATNGLDAEHAALAQMAKLRPHQLVHPDLVTEGMNRIAQALLSVGNAPAPQAQAKQPVAPAEDHPEPFPFDPVDTAGGVAERPVVTAVPATPTGPSPARVSARPPAPPPALPAPPAAPRIVPARRVGPAEPELVVVPELPAELARDALRRQYRELVELRCLARAWEDLANWVADPGDDLGRVVRYALALGAESQFRQVTTTSALAARTARQFAPNLVALLSHPLALTVWGSLTLGQRRTLAAEWAAGRNRLAGLRLARRDTLARRRQARQLRRATLRRAARGLFRPEVLLVALGVAALGIALARSAPRRAKVASALVARSTPATANLTLVLATARLPMQSRPERGAGDPLARDDG